ncbi:hypothetical protein J6590_040175 [Homalodisca vitripennis]|nr:hypothetical protein J6590_040175 [Homalodisca vitripennis]
MSCGCHVAAAGQILSVKSFPKHRLDRNSPILAKSKAHNRPMFTISHNDFDALEVEFRIQFQRFVNQILFIINPLSANVRFYRTTKVGRKVPTSDFTGRQKLAEKCRRPILPDVREKEYAPQFRVQDFTEVACKMSNLSLIEFSRHPDN